MRNHHKLLVPTTSTTTSSPSSKNNNANNKQEEPHLSGAYIRSLVKQLSSSSTARSKDHTTAMGTKPHPPQDQEPPQTTAPHPQPHKKQVRRRLHTTRPYQERLLNMAEARREIVTALKIHRASMRQAKEQQQQHQQLLQLQHQHQQQDQVVVQEQQQTQQQATRASAAMGYSSFSDYLYNSPLTHFSAPPTTCYSSPLPDYHHTPASSAAPHMVGGSHGLVMDHLQLPLPAQPLGLNLSFHGFNSVDVVADIDVGGKLASSTSFDPPLLHHQPSPTSSYSVYSSPSVAAGPDMSSSACQLTGENTSLAAAGDQAADTSMHRVLDEEEMAAIYSIGEQHDIEWSDTVNLVTSAWWSKLLDTVEGGGGDAAAAGQEAAAATAGDDVNASPAEDELTAATTTRTPDWFGDSCLGHHHHQRAKESSSSDVLGMHFSEYYHHHHGISYAGEDVSLPRMDLGEIEGWDAEWFS